MIGIAIKLLSSRWLHYALLIAAVLWFRNDAAKWQYAHSAAVSAGRAGIEAQKALNLAISARYSALERKSTDDYRPALESAHAAVVRYVAVNRVPECPASQASGPDTAAVPGDTPPPIGAGPASGLAAITLAELDDFAANTVRAESCRAWGQSLIDSGLAIAGD